MSEAAKAARAANKAKANRLAAGDPKAKVDASSWTPPEMMNTEKKTGLRPVSRRAYKRGGKVHGEVAAQNAGRKPRKSGGKLPTEIAESHVNRNVKDANAKFGKPHTGGYASGGYAKGGRPAKAGGGSQGSRLNEVVSEIPHENKKKPYTVQIVRVAKDGDPARSPFEVRHFKNGEHIPDMDTSARDLEEARDYQDYGATRLYPGDNMRSSHERSREVFGRDDERDPVRQRERGSSYEGMKKGGRAKKMDGGPMGDPRAAAADRMAAANQQAGVPSGRMSFVERQGTPLPGSGMKKGGRTGKANGGHPIPRPKPTPDEYNDRDITPSYVFTPDFKETQEQRKAPSRYAAKGGKIENFEGSAKDEAQDKKLAKKRGMSMKAWEASEADAKHDKQQSMAGLKKGGRAGRATGGRAAKSTGGDILKAISPISMLMNKGGKAGNYTGGTRPTGGRIAKASGGLLSSLMGGPKASEGKSKSKKKGTNISIVINAGQKPADPMAGLPMLPPGKPPMLPPAMSAGAPAPAGGMDMPPPDMGGGAPGAPPGGAPGGGLAAMLGRKAGGRVGHRSYSSYKDMDAGAGGGLGRLEKTQIAKKTYKK